MAYLSSAELASIRADYKATLPETCAIDYPTWASDGAGGGSNTWTSRGTAIACRVAPVSSRTFPRITAEQVREARMMTLYLAHDQSIGIKDRVTANSNVYYVRQVNPDDSELFAKIALLEIRE